MKFTRKIGLLVALELCFFIAPFYLSQMPVCRAQTEPYGLHLTYINCTETNTSICVTYFTLTDVPTNAKWGLSSSNLDNSATGTTTYQDLVSKYVHEVNLTNLVPDTVYYYQVGNDTTGWSSIYSFRSGINQSNFQTFKFVAYGDTRTNIADRQAVLSAINWEVQNNDARFVLHGGDLIGTYNSLTEWNQWFSDVETVATSAPMMTVRGNHDAGDNYWGVQYANPDNGPLMGSSPNEENDYDYWFIYANVFLINLDCNFQYGSPGSTDYAWLNATLDLAQNLRGNGSINWVIMQWHNPPYNGGDNHGEDTTIQNNLCPVIEAAGVDVVFNGHEHIYERNAQIRNKAIITKDSLISYARNASVPGTIYIISGVGGAPKYDVPSPPAYEVTHVLENGYALCNVTLNATATTLQVEMRGDTHNVIDTGVTIIKWLQDFPNPPEMNSISPNPSTTGLIQVNWTAVPNADNYTVYRHTTPITVLNETVTTLGTVDVTNYNDTIAENGTFFYVVTARNATGLSNLSNWQSVEVILYTPDAPILEVLESTNTNGTIPLKWNAVANADNYTIYRHTAFINEVNASVTTLDTVDVPNYNDNVTRDGTYFYVIRASNETGNSSLSNCEPVIVDLPSPDAPTLTGPLSPNTNGSIPLSWNAVTLAENYSLFRHPSFISEINNTVEWRATGTDPGYNDTVTRDGTYFYVVMASNATGNSTPSNCIPVEVDLPGPAIPVLDPISPAKSTTGRISLTWNAVFLVENYSVYRSTASISVIDGNVTLLGTTTGTSWVDQLAVNGTFYYAIIASNATGVSVLSNCESVTVELQSAVPTDFSGYLVIPFIGLLLVLFAKVHKRGRGEIQPQKRR